MAEEGRRGGWPLNKKSISFWGAGGTALDTNINYQAAAIKLQEEAFKLLNARLRTKWIELEKNLAKRLHQVVFSKDEYEEIKRIVYNLSSFVKFVQKLIKELKEFIGGIVTHQPETPLTIVNDLFSEDFDIKNYKLTSELITLLKSIRENFSEAQGIVHATSSNQLTEFVENRVDEAICSQADFEQMIQGVDVTTHDYPWIKEITTQYKLKYKFPPNKDKLIDVSMCRKRLYSIVGIEGAAERNQNNQYFNRQCIIKLITLIKLFDEEFGQEPRLLTWLKALWENFVSLSIGPNDITANIELTVGLDNLIKGIVDRIGKPSNFLYFDATHHSLPLGKTLIKLPYCDEAHFNILIGRPLIHGFFVPVQKSLIALFEALLESNKENSEILELYIINVFKLLYVIYPDTQSPIIKDVTSIENLLCEISSNIKSNTLHFDKNSNVQSAAEKLANSLIERLKISDESIIGKKEAFIKSLHLYLECLQNARTPLILFIELLFPHKKVVFSRNFLVDLRNKISKYQEKTRTLNKNETSRSKNEWKELECLNQVFSLFTTQSKTAEAELRIMPQNIYFDGTALKLTPDLIDTLKKDLEKTDATIHALIGRFDPDPESSLSTIGQVTRLYHSGETNVEKPNLKRSQSAPSRH